MQESPLNDSEGELRRLLEDGASHLGIQLDGVAFDRLTLLTELLLEGNRHLNLTAIREPREVVLRHMVDSLTGLAAIDALDGADASIIRAEPLSVLDLGTGGGFP